MNIETNTEEEKPAAMTFGTYLAPELAELVRADAAADDRTPSYIIREIVKAHYAKRARTTKTARRVAA